MKIHINDSIIRKKTSYLEINKLAFSHKTGEIERYRKGARRMILNLNIVQRFHKFFIISQLVFQDILPIDCLSDNFIIIIILVIIRDLIMCKDEVSLPIKLLVIE